MIDRLTARLDGHVAGVLAGGMSPAAAVAMTDRAGTLLVRTYGRVAGDTLWQIGSIGKSLTAVVALQLAEEGLIDLRAPVTDALPWFSVRSRFGPITPHHLLTHTAGIIEGSEIATASIFDVVALRDSEAGSGPGERFHYSNVGYRTIGCALEHVTGRPYPDLVSERVLDRLGMRDSTASIVHETRRRLAPAHTQFYDDRPWRPEHGLVPATWIESAEA
ncbi:MAG: serine hydrolase domain-containing protein, partial [Gaiellales bacterium]